MIGNTGVCGGARGGGETRGKDNQEVKMKREMIAMEKGLILTTKEWITLHIYMYVCMHVCIRMTQKKNFYRNMHSQSSSNIKLAMQLNWKFRDMDPLFRPTCKKWYTSYINNQLFIIKNRASNHIIPPSPFPFPFPFPLIHTHTTPVSIPPCSLIAQITPPPSISAASNQTNQTPQYSTAQDPYQPS